MIRARIGFFATFAAAAALGLFAACASEDVTSSALDPDASTALPALDAALVDGSAPVDSAPLDPCLPATFCPVASAAAIALDVRTRVTYLGGRSATDVWATGAHGTVLHYDGATWQRSDVGTIETLPTLWPREAGEVAIASLSGLFTRDLPTDGGAEASDGGWTAETPTAYAGADHPPGTVTSSWTTTSAEWLWVTTQESGPNGLWRMHYVAATKILAVDYPLPDPLCGIDGCSVLSSIHGISADDLWAVGGSGAALHITGAQSQTPAVSVSNSQTIAALNGVWAAAANDVWAVGGVGVVRHYTGTPGLLEVVDPIPTTNTLRAVWGTSATDIWAVGDNATVLHFDGHTWTLVPVTGLEGRRPDLYAVWTMSPGHAWVGGEGVLLSIGGTP